MSAATLGYQNIGDSSNNNVPISPMGEKIITTEHLMNQQQQQQQQDEPDQQQTKLQAVTSRATAAAVATRDAMNDIIRSPMPEINLYTEPINPSTSLTMNDRIQLILQSCRPWNEFFDLKSFNIPIASEIKLRFGHNIEIFFYNYLVVAFSYLFITALFHPLRAFLISIIVFVAILLYIMFPEDYYVNDGFIINKFIKNCILISLIIFSIWIGHVLPFFFFFSAFFIPTVLLHAFLREHSSVPISTI